MESPPINVPFMSSLKGGLHVIGLLDSHVAIACVPVVCALEIAASVYIYGTSKLSRDIYFMTGSRLTQFWLILWKYVIPILLSVITVYSLREVSSLGGWCVAMASVICIPIYAANKIFRSEGSLKQRIRECSLPSKDWCPKDEDIKVRWMVFQTKQEAPHTTLPLNNLYE